MSADQYLVAVRDIVATLAAAGGLAAALLGLSTCRKQLKGTAEWELARRLLRAVYVVRDALKVVRCPIMMSGEMVRARDELARAGAAAGHPAAEIDEFAAAYQLRWDRVRRAHSDLDVECLEAEVLWGDAVAKALEPLRAATGRG